MGDPQNRHYLGHRQLDEHPLRDSETTNKETHSKADWRQRGYGYPRGGALEADRRGTRRGTIGSEAYSAGWDGRSVDGLDVLPGAGEVRPALFRAALALLHRNESNMYICTVHTCNT